MCYHTKQSASLTELMKRFGTKKAPAQTALLTSDHFNGFDHPETPVITSLAPDEIQLFKWGLVPAWADTDTIANKTLNARIETVRELPSFRDVVHQKCLVLVNGFYEWKWLDPKGKQKQQYLIGLPGDEPFALAGLWSRWNNPAGETVHSYTIITTTAVGIMREIHNSKLRMPVILPADRERAWLMGERPASLEQRLVAREV